MPAFYPLTASRWSCRLYDLSGPKTVEAMKKRHFDAYYCSTAAEAVEKALELIPKTDSVSWGGVMTVDELGLKQRLAGGLYPHRPGYR